MEDLQERAIFKPTIPWLTEAQQVLEAHPQYNSYKQLLFHTIIDDAVDKAVTTHRIMRHWESLGIVQFSRKSGNPKGWRELTGKELIWFSIALEIRKFGIGLEKLKIIRNDLFTESNNSPHTENELLFYSFLSQLDQNIRLIITNNGTCEFMTDTERQYTLADLSISYISVDFGHIMRELGGKLVSLRGRLDTAPASSDEIQILDILSNIKNGDLHIYKRNNEIKKITKATEHLANDALFSTKIEKGFYGEETKAYEGKGVIKIIRKEKIRLKK